VRFGAIDAPSDKPGGVRRDGHVMDRRRSLTTRSVVPEPDRRRDASGGRTGLSERCRHPERMRGARIGFDERARRRRWDVNR
jgi:hypothetical protein